jgi:MFS family permease
MMNLAADVENEHEEGVKTAPKKQGFLSHMMATLEKKYPKLMELLKDIRVQAFLLFLILLIFYLNLIIWDFYFSSDSIGYGLTVKNWFEEEEVDNYNLLRPAHPLTMPMAILFTYLVRPIIGSNYLLSYAILDAILGAATVAVFYLVCLKFVDNRKFSLICSLALAFSFAFWENCEMAEDKSLGFFLFTLYIPLLFAFVGEIKPFKWFDGLKAWQKGLVTGIFLGLVIAAHFSFVLLFLFFLFLGWRYRGLKFFKSSGFILSLLGTALVCGIVFGIVAFALEVSSFGDFIGMFTQYHTGEGGEQYFALAKPGEFSLTTQLRGTAGGVFTTLFMFISQNTGYKVIIIAIGAIVLLIMAYILLYARKNKVVSSFYVLMVIWFANYFFFAPDDRNAWVYLLIPVWLSICIGLDIIEKEGLRLIFLKRKLPDKVTKAITPAMVAVVIVLLLNNTIVFSDAHFNHDEREKFVNFVDQNILDDDAIFIVDESMTEFFSYYSDKESINFAGVVLNPQISDYINNSFDNGTAIYLGEYWLLDSYVKVGSPRTERTYEERLELHREYITNFNSMYTYELAYPYEWSDIYRIMG